MVGLRQYVISVVLAALICGILSSLVQNSQAKELIRLLGGVFLAFTVLRPVTGLDFSAITEKTLTYSQEAEAAAGEGVISARETMADIIKLETEAYILDKAAELGAGITVTVTVSEDDVPIPVSAELSGSIAPGVRQRLEGMIQADLGITKENLKWIG